MTDIAKSVETLVEKATKAGDSGDAMRYAQAALNAANVMLSRHAAQPARPTDEQIERMVDRFLCWRLPDNFAPDAGINYKPCAGPGPTGTNLFDATQARAMVQHMIEGMAAA